MKITLSLFVLLTIPSAFAGEDFYCEEAAARAYAGALNISPQKVVLFSRKGGVQHFDYSTEVFRMGNTSVPGIFEIEMFATGDRECVISRIQNTRTPGEE